MSFLPKYTEFRGSIKNLELNDTLFIKLLIAVALVALVALMFPRSEAIEYEYTVGDIWVDQDLIAPFSFPIYKEEQQYEKEKHDAVSNVYPVFARSEHAEETQRESLLIVLEQFRLMPRLQSVWMQRQKLTEILNDVLRIGIVDQRRPIQTHKFVAIRKGTEEEIIPYDRFYD